MPTNKKLNVIIPMAGSGKRFRRAGYSDYKPFISIQGKPMIKHVLDAFPEFVKKYVVTSPDLISKQQRTYLENELHCTVIDIDAHIEGPAYSIFAARQQLPLDEAFFIAYCDIVWSWNFNDVIQKLDNDGVVYTHTGFHPHLVGNSYSAFCLPTEEDATQLAEIREKECFTDDWLNEPVSIGAFYIKNGHDMITAIKTMIDTEVRVSGEFFPSLIFNYLLANKQQVVLDQLDFYLHWGVPEQLQDFERWQQIMTDQPEVRQSSSNKIENVMTMAGSGSRMKMIAELPKALLSVYTQPMYQYVMQHFPVSDTLFVTIPQVAEGLKQDGIDSSQLHILDKPTKSQYETLKVIKDAFLSKKNFFITSCDAYGLFDYAHFFQFIETTQPDAIIFTFKPSLLQDKLPAHHTYVSTDAVQVTAVHIKSKLNADDRGLAGFFWLKDGAMFNDIDKVPVDENNEMSVDHVFKYFVDSGLKVMRYELEQYVHLGTKEEYLEYQYWYERRNLFKLNEQD